MTPVAKLLPPSGRERAEVRTWEALGDGMLDAAILVRLERTQRPAEQQSQKWIDRQMGKIHAGLAAMSRGLGEKPWCNGNGYSLADIAVGCTLGYLDFRFAHIDWRDTYPNLARLNEKLAARPSFAETQPLLWGLLLGTGYIVGELPNSFAKRQLAIAPGAAGQGVAGRVFWVVDQLDSLFGMLLFVAPVWHPSPGLLAAIVAIMLVAGMGATLHPLTFILSPSGVGEENVLDVV